MKINQTKLLESQTQLIQAGFLKSNRNWVVCAPTGAGKTRMAEWALQKTIAEGRRGVFIAPLKAIVEEKATDWADRYPHFNIGLFTGETTRAGSHKSPRDENLLLMTSEKLSSYLHGWKRHLAWLSEIDVVVLDEFHLLGDAGRGATLETLIGRLQRINPFVRFIGLSATIPNADQLATWLRAESFVTTWRPGFDTTGESVLFLPKWHKNAEEYLTGFPAPVTSGLSKARPLQKELITEVATRLSISTAHLTTNFTERSFCHMADTPLNLSFLIEKLLAADLLKRSGDSGRYLTETPLGRIATQMDVSPESIQILDRFYQQVPGPCLFDCLLAVCLCPELTPKLPFYFEQIDDMAGTLT